MKFESFERPDLDPNDIRGALYEYSLLASLWNKYRDIEKCMTDENWMSQQSFGLLTSFQYTINQWETVHTSSNFRERAKILIIPARNPILDSKKIYIFIFESLEAMRASIDNIIVEQVMLS
jgi:hypothetical protein